MTKTMMKINNKAQSQMWWIIMAAVIALIVAVVLLLMFSRGTGKVESGLSACETAGGACLSESDCRQQGGNLAPAALFECADTKKCCLSIKKSSTDNS